MAAGNWTIYHQFKLKFGQKAINLGSDAFKVALFTSSSNCGSASLGTATYAALTNEVANGNGYTTGGATLSSVSWSNSSGTETFTAASPSWTASGGSIVARFAVLYDSTTGDLVAYCLLDSTPADLTVPDGVPFTLQINAAGIFTLA